MFMTKISKKQILYSLLDQIMSHKLKGGERLLRENSFHVLKQGHRIFSSRERVK